MVSLGLMMLRVVVGGLFAVHGYAKVFGGPGKSEAISPAAEKFLGKGFKQQLDYGGVENLAGFLQSIEIPYPKPMAYAVQVSELGGGLALMLGWHTRLAALGLLVGQLVAIQKVHGPHGMISTPPDTGWEYNLSLVGATAALALAGPGAISVDN